MVAFLGHDVREERFLIMIQDTISVVFGLQVLEVVGVAL